ncbi:MAG TPA: hypothetical protein VFR88_06330 [Microlunatus sp.]|nr:hypothetical protein [Microlunatus sp.]
MGGFRGTVHGNTWFAGSSSSVAVLLEDLGLAFGEMQYVCPSTNFWGEGEQAVQEPAVGRRH